MGLLDDADSSGSGESYTALYHENGDAMDEVTAGKFWNYYLQVNNLEEQHDAKKSETVGEFYDKAIREIAGKNRTAKMLQDYFHRSFMIKIGDNWYTDSMYGSTKMWEETPGNQFVTFK